MRASAGLAGLHLVERLSVIGPGLTVGRAELPELPELPELLRLVRIEAGDCASR